MLCASIVQIKQDFQKKIENISLKGAGSILVLKITKLIVIAFWNEKVYNHT